MLLNESYNDVDYDAIETISWQRHLEEDYDEDDEGNVVEKKQKTTDYAKIAKALGDIINRGIQVSLIDINKSAIPIPKQMSIIIIALTLKKYVLINAINIIASVNGPTTSFNAITPLGKF